MAHIEYNQLSAQLAKLGELCKDNGFQYRFEKDLYPIRIVITPD